MMRREIEQLLDGMLSQPRFPTPTIARFCGGNIVADALIRALAPVVPDRVSAGVGNLKVTAYSGLLRDGRHWVHMCSWFSSNVAMVTPSTPPAPWFFLTRSLLRMSGVQRRRGPTRGPVAHARGFLLTYSPKFSV